MRWIWIDRFESFEQGKAAVAIKNVTAAEEHLHDLYPGFALMPSTLMIEGMAQTAGILVGAWRNFQEKVILAKIGKATFVRLVRPGETLIYRANILQINEVGASVEGKIFSRQTDESGTRELAVGEVEMMFSHIDQNLAGARFPEFNFVFNSEFMALFDAYRRDMPAEI